VAGQSLIRVAALALGLSTLSFAAGVAGDLSIIDPPRTGQRVVLRIPPEIPADAIRAGPLPSLVSTASAAEPVRFELASAPLEALDLQAAKPQARLEVQLARAVPKAAQIASIAQDERKSA
jgi:hypothetical protein